MSRVHRASMSMYTHSVINNGCKWLHHHFLLFLFLFSVFKMCPCIQWVYSLIMALLFTLRAGATNEDEDDYVRKIYTQCPVCSVQCPVSSVQLACREVTISSGYLILYSESLKWQNLLASLVEMIGEEEPHRWGERASLLYSFSLVKGRSGWLRVIFYSFPFGPSWSSWPPWPLTCGWKEYQNEIWKLFSLFLFSPFFSEIHCNCRVRKSLFTQSTEWRKKVEEWKYFSFTLFLFEWVKRAFSLLFTSHFRLEKLHMSGWIKVKLHTDLQ